MRRRDLFTLAGGAVLWPLAAHAQQAPLPVVAFLHAASLTGHERSVAALRAGLAEAGYVDGKNVTIELRWAEGHYERLPGLVAELVRDRVAVIATGGVPAALAAKSEDTTIPIVFLVGDDPIREGLVASLSRPGGNATGLSMLTAGLNAKRVEMMHELLPSSTRFGLLVNPGNADTDTQISECQTAVRSFGRELRVARAHSAEEIDAAFATLAQQQIDALIVGADPLFASRQRQITDLAARDRLPAVYEWSDFVASGGLMSYGSNLSDNYRHIGIYAGKKFLAGAKPADLPVVQPTKFELVINLKAARALGLTVPPLLLARADEVVE